MHFFSATPPPYPHLVYRLMVVSAVLCALCIIGWFFAPSDASKVSAQLRQSINTGGGDNSGAQMYAARDLHAHYYGTSVPSPVEPVEPTPPPAPSEERPARAHTATTPTLKFSRGFEQVIFDYRQRGWRMALPSEPESIRAIVLWAENPFPTQGQGRDLQHVIASIRAEQLDSLTVSRAYWIRQPDNEITLKSGGKLGVIVGYFNGREQFVSFNNPHSESFRHILDDGFRTLGEKSTLSLVARDSNAVPLSITVTIAQMPSQTVIACKKIVITLPYVIVDVRDCNEG
jgi:hypothetical protein